MQKISKNLTAIQKKFESLKSTHSMYEEPTPIGEVAQLMTYGVVSEGQVQDYLEYIKSSQQIQAKESINQKWFDLNIQQMILFLDKVIKYRNINKPNQLKKQSRLNVMSVKKKKTKKKNSDTHQNPYIPAKIQILQKDEQNQKNNAQIASLLEKQNQQQQQLQQQIQSPYVSSQDQVQQVEQFRQNGKVQYHYQQENIQIKQKSKEQILGLPQNFKNLSVEERYQILSTKYQTIKFSLEKKFNSIYVHYRKQMYIPHQSFQKNNQLLMDLRTFLKYYRDFEISKKYRAHTATKQFKKASVNGLWLDYEKFIDIHYKIIELLSTNDNELNQRLQKGELKDKRKVNELKKALSKNAKMLVQNLYKLNDLSELISDQKIRKMINDNSNKKMIKKIVEVHSGLIKEDVLLKLNQRVEQRKKKNVYLLNNSLISKYNTENSPQMSNSLSPLKLSNEMILKLSPHKLSIYKELQIPKLRSRELKKTSIYSSLQLLNMHKQKEKLKQLINEQQNENYLEVYFKKEKLLDKLIRSNSIELKKSERQMKQKSSHTFSLKSQLSIKSSKSQNILLRSNLSLPRMKFS